jgi:hypothetical protein
MEVILIRLSINKRTGLILIGHILKVSDYSQTAKILEFSGLTANDTRHRKFKQVFPIKK